MTKNYVDMAKNLAKQRKIEHETLAASEAAAAKVINEELGKLCNLLKEAVKQWDKKCGLKYEDCGENSHWPCCRLKKKSVNFAEFTVAWRTWDENWSDDCTTTNCGSVAEVKYFQDEYLQYNSVFQRSFSTPRTYEAKNGNLEQKVDDVMQDFAKYMSKFM